MSEPKLSEKLLNTLGIYIHNGELIRWKILEVNSKFYICPNSIGFRSSYEGAYNNKTVELTLRGECNEHVLSRVIPNAKCFLGLFEELLKLASLQEWNRAKGYGIPIAWGRFADPHSSGFTGYLSVEQYLTPFDSLKDAVKFLKDREPDMIFNSTGQHYGNDELKIRTYMGLWIRNLMEKHGYKGLCKVLNLSRAQVHRIAQSGKIPYTVAIRLKQAYPDDDLNWFDLLIQQNSIKFDSTRVDYNKRKFAIAIRALRIINGLTIPEVQALDPELPCVSSIENGKRNIDIAMLDGLVLLYKIYGNPVKDRYASYYKEHVKNVFKTFKIHLKDRGGR